MSLPILSMVQESAAFGSHGLLPIKKALMGGGWTYLRLCACAFEGKHFTDIIEKIFCAVRFYFQRTELSHFMVS